jgi:hypothetical protein
MSEGTEGARVLSDEERARAVREQLKSLHAFDLAYEMMVSLVSFGYQKLGLTGETAELRNLDDAHYAIELLGAVLNVSDREHGTSELRDLHTTLAQMQLGYVQALEMEGRRPPEAEPRVEAEPAAAAEAPPETPSEAEAEAAHDATPEEVEADLATNLAAEQAAEAKASDEATEEKAAAGRPAAKKPAAAKPAAKKSAAKKPAAKTPAARKKPAPKPDDAG